MKTSFTQLFKKCSIVAFTLVAGWANAATYTAISSGAWTSASTWSGGTTPGNSIGGIDNVVINSGVNVTLDSDVEFTSILSSLEVNGSLTSSSDAYMLDMNSGSLTGAGTLTLHRLRFGTFGSMGFTGTSTVEKLWNNNVALSLVTQMQLNDSLFLEAGSLSMGTGGTLTFATGLVIRVNDGSMTLGSGILYNTNNYSVLYVGSDKNTGLELAGSGLTDVWVNLDDNTQSLSITGNVNINGDVHHQQGMIDLNGGSLTLMGDYMANSGAMFMGSATSNLSIVSSASLTSALMFEGSGDELNNLTIDIPGATGNVNLGSNLTINGDLMLEDGYFTLTGGTLTMANGGGMMVADGHLMLSGGAFDGTNQYNVTFSGSSSTTANVELSGSGLNDLEIDLDNETDSVSILSNLTIDGELNMNNGGIALNGYDLTIEGSLSTSSNGWFNGDASSDLTFNTNSLMGDTIWFHATNNAVGTITINAADESNLMIGNNVRLENIIMSNGGVHIWNNEIWVRSTGTITGASEDRYVMIDGTGSLVMNVQVSAPYIMYPVGTDEGYSPVSLQQNSGTAGYFKVNTVNGVWSAGTSGTNNATTESVVDRTWNISSVAGGSVNLNMMAMWSSDMEVNGFDRTDAYISHYMSGTWDSQTTSAATTVGTMFSLERENITSLSPFAVVDEAASVGIKENKDMVVQMYPNPVQDVLTCIVNVEETTTVDLVDLTGKVLYSERLTGTGKSLNHSMDFSAYPNGIYFVRYNNTKGATSYKVVKSL